jgi:staphyloferrin A synthase
VTSPTTAHTADVARTRVELARIRPDLSAGFDSAVPAARAAILARLLGAVHREPLPGVRQRDLRYPAAAAQPFALPSPGLVAHLDGQRYDDPGDLARALWPDSGFATEVDNSVANLALARTREGDDEGDVEQLVVDGHPLHPCCRTRGGMTVADVLAYAPEHRPVIRLRRLRVPQDRWHGDGPPILYAHPWQADRLRDEHPWLADDGETGPVRPLMSLRTVAPLDGGDHVKTAVDVQMTSAVRTVSPAALHNGPRLSRLLRELTAGMPLTVLAETAAGAVLVDGVPQRRMAYLRREAPRVGPGEQAVPLGALAPSKLIRDGGDPYRWLEDLARLLWPPLLTLLNRGVALEAHGQNTLVVLRHGRPHRILYRDLGGVRVSPARLRAAGWDPPPLHGDVISDDPHVLRTKLAAAAVGTVATELVTLLARQHDADPARLWRVVAAAIHSAGTADATALLREPLPVKATTAMRLAAEPLDDIWAHLDNPLAGAT